MADNFDAVLPWILAHEGGFVNHPRDPGGATNHGVTQRVYDAWRERRRLTPRSVRAIESAEVRMIYRAQFWNVLKCDDLSVGLDYAVADFGIHSGPRRAAMELQRIVGAKPDGWIGERTLAAAAAYSSPSSAIVALCERRMRFLRGLRHFDTFGRGWTRRVMGEMPGVQMSDMGVIDRGVMLLGDRKTIWPPKHVDDGAGAKAPEAQRRFVPVLLDALAAFFQTLQTRES